MKFRSRFFGFLAFVALLWVCYGLSLSSSAFSAVVSATGTPSGNLTAQQAQAARTAGAGIGAGLGITFFLCSGGLPFLIFALLSWRNSVGLRREQMHKEQIEALKAAKS